MLSKQLFGKIAIVTGAGGGIGAAVAMRLALGGAKTIVNFRNGPEKADKVVGAIRAAGAKAVAVRADISDPAQIAVLFDTAEQVFGTVTLLVNNAAVRGDPTAPAKVDLTQYEELFAVNVRGPVLCMAQFARRIGPGGGRIVNITSGQARTPRPGAGLYAGSKGALEAITRAFAADLGPQGMTVNAVAPGATATEQFTAAVPDGVKKQTIGNTALGRLGTPEDIADVVAFLLSDEARWVTGQVLDANGGLRRG